MKNTARKFPLPTSNTWGRLPERVQELEKNSTFYKALLTQTGTTAPLATIVENNTGATMTFEYSVVGTYIIKSSLPIFSTSKTIIDIGIGAIRVASTAVVNSATQITIITSDSMVNAPINGMLINHPITIQIFK
jgi:hypothetical protein